MSRIGNQPVSLPKGISVSVDDHVVTVKGPKGTLTQRLDPLMEVEIEDGSVRVKRLEETKNARALHGLYRSLINNMVEGVTEGYKKEMELVGVGYRAETQGQMLTLAVGFSHPVVMVMPPEISVEAKTERGKNPTITLESADKQLLGQMAAKIRSQRPPEPYKGKGIRFKGEQIRRKAGKAAGKK